MKNTIQVIKNRITFIILLSLLLISCENNKLPTEVSDSSSTGLNKELPPPPPPPPPPTVYYKWLSEWYNGGNGKIEGWLIRADDRFIPGLYYYGGGSTTSDEPLMMAINPSGTYGVFDRLGHFSDYHNSGKIDGWNIQSSDKYCSLSGSSNNSPYLFAVNPSSHFAMLLRYDNYYSSWKTDWSNSGNGYFGGWNIGSQDIYVSGKFNHNDPNNQQILATNYSSHWAALLSYASYNTWVSPWSNAGNGNISGWNIQSGDRYSVADFDGDGFDELFCVRANWAAILKYNGSGWTWLWSNSGNGKIEGWILNSSDKFAAGNLDNSSAKSELLVTNSSTGHASIFTLNGSSIVSLWGNGGNGYIGQHQLDSFDTHFIIRGIGIQYSNLLTINLGNARTQKFYK
jgi:hypothetical protein